MDPLVTSLINAGGLGILSAALLWLHKDALKTFREELKEERDANKEIWLKQFDQQAKQHEQVLAAVGSFQCHGDK